METTYTYEGRTRRSGGRTRKARSGGRRSVALAPRETRRLVQLCVCAALFAVVLLGRGLLPAGAEGVRTELMQLIQSNTDFRGAFERLGQSVSAGEPVVATLGNLWSDVMNGGGQTTPILAPAPEAVPIYCEERLFLASQPSEGEILTRRFGVTAVQPPPPKEATPQPPPPAEADTPSPPSAEADTLPPQPQPIYTGSPMPEGATMERLELGLDQMVAPVMAVRSSDYGWRAHPIDGGEKFHAGLDLAAAYGSAIGAFSAGVVDYIGESPAYGQYLQIDHGGGVTSFYAHCSKLCAQPGQRVSAGEKVAEVGDTGNVTGTHLHFELKKDGAFVNPDYYIETLS